MSDRPIKERAAQSGRILLYLGVLIAAGLILFNYFWKGGGGLSSLRPAQEIRLNYQAKDFVFEVDEEKTLQILLNPQRYKQEFDQLLFNFNMALLNHVADRMGVSDSLKYEVEQTYRGHHPYMVSLYMRDILALQDTSSQLYERWYKNESKGAVGILKEVSSKYTCFMVNHVMSTVLGLTEGSFKAKGKKIETPCGIAMKEGLAPMVDRLEEYAAIKDFQASRGLLEQRVEKVIAELATLEVRDKKGLNKQLQTKFLGYAVSSTDIEVSAISILKVGFKLDEFFQVELNNVDRNVIITLPSPVILSHEVYPKIDKLNIGWLREVEDEDFNKNFNLLRRAFRQDAIKDNVYEKAEEQARELMEMLFGPVVDNFNNRYSIVVRFKRNANPVDDELDILG